MSAGAQQAFCVTTFSQKYIGYRKCYFQLPPLQLHAKYPPTGRVSCSAQKQSITVGVFLWIELGCLGLADQLRKKEYHYG